MTESTKTKKYNVIEIFKRLIDISSLFGLAFCITVIFYAGSMYTQVNMLANSNKEMQSEFKELRNDIANKLDKFESILREDTRDIKTDIRDIKADIKERAQGKTG